MEQGLLAQCELEGGRVPESERRVKLMIDQSEKVKHATGLKRQATS
jgi:hypothetical protein